MDWWDKYKKGTIIISKENVNELVGYDMKKIPIIIKKNTKLKITDSFKFMIFLKNENKSYVIESKDIKKFYNTKESQKIIRKEKIKKIEIQRKN